MYWRPLLPFQDTVVERMWKQGCFINGDDTGLGKTDTAIFVSEKQLYYSPKRLVYIICLPNTREQWEYRLKFTTYRKGKIFLSEYGKKAIEKTRDYRISLYDNLDFYTYAIFSYNNLVDDYDLLFKAPVPCVVIFDEVRKVRNRNSKIHKSSVSLLNKWRSENSSLRVLGLDATLLPNKVVEELFWIMEVINPKIFGTGKKAWYKFCKRYLNFNYYGGVESYKNIDELYYKFKPYFIKRKQTHPQVAPFIPKTIEKYYTCTVGNKKLYKRIARELLLVLDEMALLVDRQYNKPPKKESSMRALILRIKSLESESRKRYISLRMDCYHTNLIVESKTRLNMRIVKELKLKKNYKEKGKIYFTIDRIKRLVAENNDNRILVMCFFLEGLNVYHELLEDNKIHSLVYKGGKEKWNVLQKFKNNKRYKVLLLQSTVGGSSLDIPQANHIFRDILQTSADMKQQNRTARLLSEYKINVMHDIVCKGTIEERIYLDNQRKDAVGKFITEGEKISKDFINQDGTVMAKLESLRSFLRNNL